MKKKGSDKGKSEKKPEAVEKVSNAGTVTPISDKLEKVSLTEQERGMVNALETNLGTAKLSLANAQIQIMALETERAKAAQKVMEANQALLDLVNSVATAHGIDTQDPTKGKWDLNTAQGVFTRVG